MCKSQREGGQRCAAHTRAKFTKTSPTDPDWETVAAEYASTREGEEFLKREAVDAAEEGDYESAARLNTVIARGVAMREANKEAAAAISRADLTTWEPVAVDTELARLHGEIGQLRAHRATSYDYVARHVARDVYNRGFRGTASLSEVEAAVGQWRRTPDTLHPNTRTALREYDKVEAADAQIADLTAQIQPLDREFTRRGGWNRAFLVTNGNGHVHSSLNCSTCHQPRIDSQGRYRPGTEFYWVTEMSDKTEAEIVEAAGERACTVCFASAPTETRNRPTRLFTPEERAQQAARVTRAAAAEQRTADRIAKGLTADGSEFVVETGETMRIRGVDRPRTEGFKTERAATTWMVSNIADYRTWRTGGLPPALEAAHTQIIEAIAAKHGQSVAEVTAEIEQKVAAKIRRDAR